MGELKEIAFDMIDPKDDGKYPRDDGLLPVGCNQIRNQTTITFILEAMERS